MEQISPKILQAKLKEYADIIIADNSYYAQILQAVNDLHALIVTVIGFDINSSDLPGTHLKTGFALSPQEAGRCISDLARTRKFARGIISAVKEKLAYKKEGPLQIMYAGCGPYAWLALLSVSYFNTDDIQFTTVDIHKDSIDSVKKIIKYFGVEKYFKNIFEADVLTLTETDIKSPDILIIETMNSGLKKEPQVSLAFHLVPMLAEEGIMIPENITITPVFTETDIRQAMQMGTDISDFKGPSSYEYDPAAELDLAAVSAAGAGINKPFKEITIELNKDFLLPNYDLELKTEIRVWKDEIIKDMDSALSLPIKIENAGNLAGKSSIRFSYQNNANPGFQWEIL